MSDDPVEDIADAVVVFLNGLGAATPRPLFEFRAEKCDDPNAILYAEALSALKVLVVPFGETAEKIGRAGQAIETYSVNLIVARSLSGVERSQMSVFTRQLAAGVRREGRMAGYAWMGSETVVKFDPAILHQHNRFASMTRLSYVGTS